MLCGVRARSLGESTHQVLPACQVPSTAVCMLSPLETALIALLLVVLMFGMGATLTVQRFRDVAQNPRALLIGLASQFGWMPLLAFTLATVLELPQEAALGLIIMGTCPGGTTSNMFAYYARADVALSVSMTAASKLAGVVLMPICLWLYARPFTDSAVAIPYLDIVKTLLVLLLPVALGITLRRKYGEGFAHKAEKVGSLAGLITLLLLVGISVFRNGAAFAHISAKMYAAAILLGSLGMLLGDLAARVAKLAEPQRRAVSFETGIQNSPLAFAVIATSFSGPLQAKMLELPMLYALFVLLEASLVTLLLRSRTPSELQGRSMRTI
ncbi:MAG TPA: bile acid:sodium symporter [Polyangiales bacterium]|nr:bile acid:sodium symporter [Polyangiales bacterium]